MTDLKACPFCGSRSQCWVHTGACNFYVICNACKTFGPSGKTPGEAINVWNHREEAQHDQQPKART
ncbi:Lar family restriction alleviation protein [Desulfitobacterium hafniense]|uniref:Lar family restriction alleviation protein n=1 Tax=Desulfitobacterium hafniense TaxID=49338 RepID=UPI0009B71CDF